MTRKEDLLVVTAGSFLLEKDWETNSNLEAANAAFEDYGPVLHKQQYIYYWCLFHLELTIKELKLTPINVVFNKALLYFLHIKTIWADRFLSNFYFSLVLAYILFQFYSVLRRPPPPCGAFENVRPWLCEWSEWKSYFLSETCNLQSMKSGMGCQNIDFLLICIKIVVF